MGEILQGAWAYAQIMSVGEFFAVLLALAYVALAARESKWCWPAGVLSSILFTVLFFENQLKFDMLLNAYYVLIGIYGWYSWQSGGEQTLLPIRRLRKLEWVGILPAIALSVGLGYFAATYWQSGFWQTDFPYLDAATTVFAVWATWMVTRRVLENWLFWIVIDAVSIYLYVQKGLYFTAVLFFLYVFIAVVGYLRWRKSFRLQAQQNQQSLENQQSLQPHNQLNQQSSQSQQNQQNS